VSLNKKPEKAMTNEKSPAFVSLSVSSSSAAALTYGAAIMTITAGPEAVKPADNHEVYSLSLEGSLQSGLT
jgi:hypothetical protein